MSEMKAMTELACKDIKLQNDRTYRVYLYPDSSPCAVSRIEMRSRERSKYRDAQQTWRERTGMARAMASPQPVSPPPQQSGVGGYGIGRGFTAVVDTMALSISGGRRNAGA